MDLLEAAKIMKYFIDTMPMGACTCVALGVDARETEGYKIAASVIESAEAEVAAKNFDAAKCP